MDLLFYQLRAAYRQDPGFTIFFVVLSLAAGFGFGLRILGPALFG